MEFKAKGIVLIIMIVVSLALAAVGFSLFQKEHAKNIQLGNQVQELTTKQKIAEAKLNEAQKALAGFETKLKDSTAQINALNSQLQEEKVAKEEALARMTQMQDDLDQQKKMRSDLEKNLNKAQDDVRNIKVQLRKINTEKARLEEKLKTLEGKSDVELGKIVVSPESGQAVQPLAAGSAVAAQGLEGKVLVLNKEYNFVVINLGAKDGLAAGELFSVYRGNTYLGDVKVEKVQDVMSAAGFVADDVKNKVKEGDRVVKKSK
jgi:chromosome segregation ATPase